MVIGRSGILESALHVNPDLAKKKYESIESVGNRGSCGSSECNLLGMSSRGATLSVSTDSSFSSLPIAKSLINETLAYQVIVKPCGSACNMICDYCYYTHKGESRPLSGNSIMSEDLASCSLVDKSTRIRKVSDGNF